MGLERVNGRGRRGASRRSRAARSHLEHFDDLDHLDHLPRPAFFTRIRNMPSIDLPVRRGFGETLRRDAWWVQPAVVFAFFGVHRLLDLGGVPERALHVRAVSLAVLFPGSFGDSPHAWFGPKPGWWPSFAAVLAGAADPAGPRAGSVSPATTTAAPTTRRSGPTRRPAPSASRARAIAARASFPLDLPEHPPLLPVPRAGLPRACSRYDVWKALWFADPRPGRPSSASASARLCSPLNVVLPRRLHASAATRCGIWSAASSTVSSASPVRTPATSA